MIKRLMFVVTTGICAWIGILWIFWHGALSPIPLILDTNAIGEFWIEFVAFNIIFILDLIFGVQILRRWGR